MADDIPMVTIENARLIFRNFSGKEGKFNDPGDRNFAVVLTDEMAEALLVDGWNVKVLEPREEGEAPTPYLGVKVEYKKGRPPRVVSITSGGKVELDENSVEILDWADIRQVDLIVRPYTWSMSDGKHGVKAYLKSMFVTIEEDELERKYNINSQEAMERG